MAATEPAAETECRVAAQAVCRGRQDAKIMAVAAVASRTGQAHIAVRVGRVLVYVEDRAALASFTTAWEQAARLAERVFPPVPDAFDLVERRERRQFEKGRRARP